MDIIKRITDHRGKILFGTLTFLITGFIALSIFVVVYPPSSFDVYFSEEIQERNTLFFKAVMTFVSWFGTARVSVLMVLSTSALFFIFRYRREAFYTLMTLCSGIISSLLKYWIDRPRPTSAMVTIWEETSRQSFPSGHTLFYTIFFGFLLLIMVNVKSIPKWFRITVAFISLFMIFLIPVSRVFLGAHWITDVLGGFLLGIICLYGLGYLYLRTSTTATKV